MVRFISVALIPQHKRYNSDNATNLVPEAIVLLCILEFVFENQLFLVIRLQ